MALTDRNRVYELRGVVQGVGFRPALFRLATREGIRGWVQNQSGTVLLSLEGSAGALDTFMANLPDRLPPNARIDSVRCTGDSPATAHDAASGFTIRESISGDTTGLTIPADLAICEDCRAEILDPTSRRYGYPFTTCTRCGPRYTVVTRTPYDRERTTLAPFPLCPPCMEEYTSVTDRRFHAESMACPDCGPRLSLLTATGETIDRPALQAARAALCKGRIIAVRGIGGFLLAADATNPDALARLRERKERPHKPFALMARNLDTAARYAHICSDAERLLCSPAAPIVILDTRPSSDMPPTLPLSLVTPDADTIGLMLPNSPLHVLLFEPLEGDPVPPFDVLVMTSGNRRGEPICLSSGDACDRLADIADFILTHDREINLRNDDSLFATVDGAPQVWRRARGLAPEPVRLPQRLERCVLAMGAELKNTVALGHGSDVVLSPHVGDLETLEAVTGHEQVARSLPAFLDRKPDTVAVDLHPDMHATALGRRLAEEWHVPLVTVQHHHAHAAACLAEHGHLSGLALAFDGTGLGPDGRIWGAELLCIDHADCRRLGTFAGVPLPGADAAVRDPVRQLVARWAQACPGHPETWFDDAGVPRSHALAWQQQIRAGTNAPVTHAAGRLFDAYSVLLGLTSGPVTYEAQAAIRLESEARRHTGDTNRRVSFEATESDGLYVVDWGPAFEDGDALLDMRREIGQWAMAFHEAVARAAVAMVHYAASCSEHRRVALCGGVFMNRILTECVTKTLQKDGFEVLVHRVTPPNDGSIALGQAVVAGTRRLSLE